MSSPTVFRKVALERLSSPEQLDRLLHVTNPKNWLALAALVALIGVSVGWGYMGQVTTKVAGNGVLIRSGGVQSVVPLGTGRVTDLSVHVGDHITAGQVIGTIAQPSLLEQIRVVESQLTEATRQRNELLNVRADRSRLQLAFLARQRSNLEQEISDLQHQAKLVQEQIPVDEELLSKGLITKQQTYLTREKLVGIQSNIGSRHAQITQLDSMEFQTRNESLEANLQSDNRIAEFNRELQVLQKELEMQSKVVTPYAGQVVEVQVSPGSLVQVGTPVISLQPDVVKLEAVLFTPAARAKEVQPEMDAEISPTEVRREEFGYIRGKVTFIADYPATEEALMRIFENAPLVRTLISGGPVTEVHVEMQADPSTPTGYRWSSAQGAPIKLSGGALCQGEIVTRKQRPVTLVFPYMKEKLGLR